MTKDLHKQALIRGLLFSSPLVSEMAGATRFDQSVLELPEALPELNFEQKLGHIYEDALGVLLEGSRGVVVLEKSLQIFNAERRTLGELDYVLQLADRVVHLELAVKFYMIYYEGDEVRCPGPDPTDHWYNKLERLESHQLMMSQNAYAKALLAEKYAVDDVEVQHLIYGRLFDHIAEVRRPILRGIANDAQRSTWLYTKEWSEHFSDDEPVYIIPKPLWPVPVSEFSDALLGTLRECSVRDALAEISSSERCEMVYRRGWGEPLFVVPECWPNV